MLELRYRVSVWKGEKLSTSEGGTLVSREFAALDEAAYWLKRCDGECEIFDLSEGEKVRLFSGEVAAVSLAIRDQISKRSREAEGQRLESQRQRSEPKAFDSLIYQSDPMKPCKTCGQKIARKAFLCPHCGAGHGVFRHLVILITVLIWLWLLVPLVCVGIWWAALATMSKAFSGH